MPNAIMQRSTATSFSNTKGGDNTSLHNEIMEIHSQVPEMIKILKQMAVILKMITSESKEQYDADLQASATEDSITMDSSHIAGETLAELWSDLQWTTTNNWALELVILDWEKSGWYSSYWEYSLAVCALYWDDDWAL
ncbi:phosphotransferase enzyme family protein [Histoplasma capsulatum H143]|uniref:Phosphotransferase enzyme family protein n=1 Tax=Ajellomyces capsulatus (strain H143) TaxID=544712 RepID=C6H243_AJECH|nr:phosphotransferase enzyme family protein [Histoplasma capsulatum H143]